MRGPLGVRGFSEVADCAESGGDGPDLRETEGRVVGEEVVDGDYVVGLGFGCG